MAPPGKWDEEEEEQPTYTVPRRKFDDEEDEEDVLDSWDAAEDSDVEREKAAKAAEAKAKAEAEAAALRKSKADRIKEHQQRRKAQKEEEDSDEDSDEDEQARRARLKATEKDADLKHAEDLLGDIDLNQKRAGRKTGVISDASGDPTKSIDLSAIPLFKPATKQQFADLTAALVPLLTAQSKKPQYALWVQDFAKQLVKNLPSQDIKKVASVLTTAGNEKLKEEKAADRGGKKSKAAKSKVSLAGGRQAVGTDLTAYDDVDDGLGDDDFM